MRYERNLFEFCARVFAMQRVVGGAMCHPLQPAIIFPLGSTRVLSPMSGAGPRVEVSARVQRRRPSSYLPPAVATEARSACCRQPSVSGCSSPCSSEREEELRVNANKEGEGVKRLEESGNRMSNFCTPPLANCSVRCLPHKCRTRLI